MLFIVKLQPVDERDFGAEHGEIRIGGSVAAGLSLARRKVVDWRAGCAWCGVIALVCLGHSGPGGVGDFVVVMNGNPPVGAHLDPGLRIKKMPSHPRVFAETGNLRRANVGLCGELASRRIDRAQHHRADVGTVEPLGAQRWQPPRVIRLAGRLGQAAPGLFKNILEFVAAHPLGQVNGETKPLKSQKCTATELGFA